MARVVIEAENPAELWNSRLLMKPFSNDMGKILGIAAGGLTPIDHLICID